LPADSHVAVTTGAAVLGAGALLAGLLLLGRLNLDRIPFAVVLPDTVAVKEGADNNFRTSFQVHGGLRVRVLEREQDWARVRLANGLEGFVRTEDLGLL
jgi:SH3-like domain-containing protein